MPSSGREDIIKLASDISDATDNEIPSLLIKIKDILQQYRESSRELHEIKEAILEYDLLSWCSVVLKYDYSKASNGFATAIGIMDVLSQCCSSMNLTKYEKLKMTSLPDAVHSILYLLYLILEQYHGMVKQFGSIKYGIHAKTTATYKVLFQSAISSLFKLVASQCYLASYVLRSDNLIRLLIEDSMEMEKLQIGVLELVQRCIGVNSSSIKKLATQSLNHLLDALIFKITRSPNYRLVGLIVKILLMMVDAYPDLASKLSMRFKDLKALMPKWLGHGFDHNLKTLLGILDAGNAKLAELSRRTHAVKVIWAAYQGWKTRVAKLHKVIPSLQSSFRRKRQEKIQVALKENMGSEKKYKNERNWKRQLRSLYSRL